MRNKKLGILILCAAIIAIVIIAAIASPFILSKLDFLSAKKYQAEDLKNVDNIQLIAHSTEIGSEKNSVSGALEAIRLGADAVVVDLCFKSNGTPVITDNYENNEDAPTVESLFTALKDEKYEDIKIYFNIVQLTTLSEFNSLAVKYDMVGRIYLIGIDEQRYGLVTSDSTIVPFLLKYSITKEDTQRIADGTFTAPECIAKYGAGGLEIDLEDATPEAIEALNDFGIPFIVSGVDSTEDFCKVLLNGAGSVYVADIENSANILDEWIKAMQERYRSSVEQSLEDLKNK